jgi:imidazolonepropionase-like amidohydrolase
MNLPGKSKRPLLKKVILVLFAILVAGLVGIALLYAYLAGFFAVLPPEHLASELPAKYARVMARKADVYLIRDVSVIPMDRDTVLAHRFVLVENGRITQVAGAADRLPTEGKPVVIDGAGKYLVPGLADLHVHLNDDNNLLLLVANGVTTVRDMFGHPFHLELRQKIARGQLLGPTLFAASPVLEGPRQSWPHSVRVNTAAEARDAVVRYGRQGYDFIKIYHTLPPELYAQVLRTGDSLGIRAVGHAPLAVGLEAMLAMNQYSIEHIDLGQLRQISPGIPLERKAALIGASGKWICPTLTVHQRMHKGPGDLPRHYEQYVDGQTRRFWQDRLRDGAGEYELQKKLAGILFRSGGKLLAGTDCLNAYVPAGFSLHDELQELVSAGLPPFEALKTSTVHAAAFLGKPDAGTVAAGKRADLLLLDGNPLEDIRHTRRISGVMVRGKWFPAGELDAMLREVKAQYAH